MQRTACGQIGEGRKQILASGTGRKVEGKPSHSCLGLSARHRSRQAPPEEAVQVDKQTLQGSVKLQDQQAQQLQVEVDRKIQELTVTGDIEAVTAQLDEIILSTIAEVHPPDKRDDSRLSQDPKVQLSSKEMWRTYAKFRETKTATFLNIFAKWNTVHPKNVQSL